MQHAVIKTIKGRWDLECGHTTEAAFKNYVKSRTETKFTKFLLWALKGNKCSLA